MRLPTLLKDFFKSSSTCTCLFSCCSCSCIDSCLIACSWLSKNIKCWYIFSSRRYLHQLVSFYTCTVHMLRGLGPFISSSLSTLSGSFIAVPILWVSTGLFRSFISSPLSIHPHCQVLSSAVPILRVRSSRSFHQLFPHPFISYVVAVPCISSSQVIPVIDTSNSLRSICCLRSFHHLPSAILFLYIPKLFSISAILFVPVHELLVVPVLSLDVGGGFNFILFGTSKFSKRANMTQNMFFLKISMGCQRKQNFMLIQRSLKWAQKCPGRKL